MAKKEDVHYVDNKAFFAAMKDHRKNIRKAKREKLPPPRVSDYIGDCILRIAHKLSNKSIFFSYPFKDEMISDGIENALMYLNNFNPAKSHNPFAYFTQIIYWAFVRRIQKEKKHLATKYKMIQNFMVFDFYETVEDSPTVKNPNKYCSDYSDNYMREFVDNFENSKKKKKEKLKKAKKKKKNLENYLKA